MKKFLIVASVFAMAVALVASMGCKATVTGPTDAQKTATAEAVATAGAVVFNFPATIGNWVNPSTTYSANEQALTGIAWNNTEGHTAAGSISANIGFDTSVNPTTHQKGAISLDPGAMDLTGHTISVWLKVPASIVTAAAYSAQIMVGDTAYCFANGPEVQLTTAGWIQLTAAVNDMTYTCAFDKTVSGRISVQIYKRDANVSDAAKDVTTGAFYFDDIAY